MAPQTRRNQNQKWQRYCEGRYVGVREDEDGSDSGIWQGGGSSYLDKSRLGCKRNENPALGVQDKRKNLVLRWEK